MARVHSPVPEAKLQPNEGKGETYSTPNSAMVKLH